MRSDRRLDDGGPSVLPEFSLVAGGPLYRLARRAALVGDERDLARLGLVFAAITWLPLFVLASAEGALLGAITVPFALNLGTHVRFLVAVPLMFVAEAWVGPRLTHLLHAVLASRLVTPADVPRLDAAVRRAIRLRDSTLAELTLVALAVLAMAAGLRTDLTPDVASWRTAGLGAGSALGLAGWWYTAVSLPLFQFFFARWCWRLLIWTALLWTMSRLDLQLVPTHPDLAGGLGYAGVAQGHFTTLTVAGSTVLAAGFAEEIVFRGAGLKGYALPVAGILLVNAAVLLGPLTFFTPRLLAVKRRGLREYGVLAASYVHAFDAKWVRGTEPADEPWLGTADLQSLADLAGSFEVIRSMRVVPCGGAILISLALAAIGPMLPLFLLVFPLEELLFGLVRLLFGA